MLCIGNSLVHAAGRDAMIQALTEIPDRLDQEHIAHLVFIFEDGGVSKEPGPMQAPWPFGLNDLDFPGSA